MSGPEKLSKTVLTRGVDFGFGLVSVDMAKVPVGVEDIANPLLQFLGTRKTAIAFALPDQRAVDADLECSAGARDKPDLA
jgi:uncharacterized protein YqfA (UPF0365 family)